MAVDETVKKSTFREYYEALLIAVIFVNFARILPFRPSDPHGIDGRHLKVAITSSSTIHLRPGTSLGGLLPLREISGAATSWSSAIRCQPDTDS